MAGGQKLPNYAPVYPNPFIDRIESTANEILGDHAEVSATGIGVLAFPRGRRDLQKPAKAFREGN